MVISAGLCLGFSENAALSNIVVITVSYKTNSFFVVKTKLIAKKVSEISNSKQIIIMFDIFS